jgi:predicted phage tail protein
VGQWIRDHPGIATTVLGAVLVAASVARLGVASALTVGGLLTLLLPVIIVIGFYVTLRAFRQRPPN